MTAAPMLGTKAVRHNRPVEPKKFERRSNWLLGRTLNLFLKAGGIPCCNAE
jgi:hypothetical protein